MKTVGQVLKDARVKRKLSFKKIEDGTKIKINYIKAIESQDWEKLPEFPVVLGFVGNISEFLKLNPKNTLALLRRDYPPKVLRVNPKPDIGKKFVWSPRLTFSLGVILVISATFLYLGFQYFNFLKTPKLNIILPKDGDVVEGIMLTVVGETDPDSVVKINNQPIIVDAEGNFSLELEVGEKTEKIVIIAKSRSGKETVVERNIRKDDND